MSIGGLGVNMFYVGFLQRIEKQSEDGLYVRDGQCLYADGGDR